MASTFVFWDVQKGVLAFRVYCEAGVHNLRIGIHKPMVLPLRWYHITSIGRVYHNLPLFPSMLISIKLTG
jgi:hypothetical protein